MGTVPVRLSEAPRDRNPLRAKKRVAVVPLFPVAGCEPAEARHLCDVPVSNRHVTAAYVSSRGGAHLTRGSKTLLSWWGTRSQRPWPTDSSARAHPPVRLPCAMPWKSRRHSAQPSRRLDRGYSPCSGMLFGVCPGSRGLTAFAYPNRCGKRRGRPILSQEPPAFFPSGTAQTWRILAHAKRQKMPQPPAEP